jgi:hypothetical protein
MSESLKNAAEQLRDNNKKTQLIYAFNGSGKTRLSRAFKALLKPNLDEHEADDSNSELAQKNILYYNAFTEDLFYWDNDLANDELRVLKIHPNALLAGFLKRKGKIVILLKIFNATLMLNLPLNLMTSIHIPIKVKS